MRVNVCNFRVPVYKGVPLPWMKWNTSLKRWFQTKYTSLKSFTFWKVSVNVYNFRIPVYKGVPLPWMKWNTSLKRWLQTKYTCLKSFTFWKASVNVYNFRVPVYKGVPLPWMKRNASFNDECWSSILVWRASLSEKWALNYTTLGFPFIRGFPSHGWNETHPLTMTADQVYEFEKFQSLISAS